MSWMPSAIVIAQSIAKVLAPKCMQDELPVLECVFEYVLGTVFSKGADQKDGSPYGSR